MALPKMDVPIGVVEWEVFVPEQYTARAIDGNVIETKRYRAMPASSRGYDPDAYTLVRPAVLLPPTGVLPGQIRGRALRLQRQRVAGRDGAVGRGPLRHLDRFRHQRHVHVQRRAARRRRADRQFERVRDQSRSPSRSTAARGASTSNWRSGPYRRAVTVTAEAAMVDRASRAGASTRTTVTKCRQSPGAGGRRAADPGGRPARRRVAPVHQAAGRRHRGDCEAAIQAELTFDDVRRGSPTVLRSNDYDETCSSLERLSSSSSAAPSAPGSPRSAAAAERASPPGQECPPGTTETRPGSCQAPSDRAAEHRRLPAEEHARHRRAQGAEGEVPGRSTSTAIQGQLTQDSMKRLVETMDPLNLRVLTLADNISGDRLVQTDRRDQRVAVQGSFPRARRHQLPQRRPGLGRQGDRSSCAPTSRPARLASARSASSSGCASPSPMARD